MINVLFVCLGNICRSPLAEGIFKKLVHNQGLDKKIMCDSAGTSGWHIGDLPDPRTEDVAENHGIHLDHLGRKFILEDFNRFDYIIAMDRNNFADIRLVLGSEKFDPKKLRMMRDFDDLGKGEDVPDPYYGGADGFEYVYQVLQRSCANLLDQIVKENKL